jgi:hypothetical protein
MLPGHPTGRNGLRANDGIFLGIAKHESPTQRTTNSLDSLSFKQISVTTASELQNSSQEDGISDAVIMTIVLLIAIHRVCANYAPLPIHSQALRRIVGLRGGRHKIGWGGFLETQVEQLEGWSTTAAKFEEVNRHAQRILVYPNHPFEPSICTLIAQFPPFFSRTGSSTETECAIYAYLGPGPERNGRGAASSWN